MTELTDHRGSVAREILTYLGHLPDRINNKQVDAAETCIAFGNCLLWIHEWLEPGKPKVEDPLNETPCSLYSLGKQFRKVGLTLWEDKQRQKTTLLGVVKNVDSRLTSIEDLLVKALTERKVGL